jgi:hypothetical protein
VTSDRSFSIADALVVSGVGFLAAAAYVLTAHHGVSWWDSGEIIACTHTLSIAHRPGFPLVMLAGRAFDFTLGGSPARTITLFSSITAGLAVALAAAFAWRIVRGVPPWARHATALAAGLAVGGAGQIWDQATRAEVYAPTLVLVFVLLHLALSASFSDGTGRAKRRLFALAFVGGLGLGLHHLTIMSVAPGVVVLALGGVFARRAVSGAGWLGALFFVVAGMTIYFYGPVRILTDPPFVWGDVSSIGSALATAFPVGAATEVGTGMTHAPIENIYGVASGLFSGVGPLVIALAVVGVVLLARRGMWVLASLGLCLVGNLAIAVKGGTLFVADNPDLAGYLAPTAAVLGVFAGLGVAGTIVWLGRKATSRILPSLVSAALLIGLVMSAAGTWRASDRSGDNFADHVAKAVLRRVPHGALLATDTINLTFVLRSKLASGYRPDVELVNRNLSSFDWRTEQLKPETRELLEKLSDGPPWSFSEPVVFELSEGDLRHASHIRRVGFLFGPTAQTDTALFRGPNMFIADASVFTLSDRELANPDNVRFLVLWLERRALLCGAWGEHETATAYREFFNRLLSSG